MEYVRLGSTGLKVSRIAFGCSSYGSTDWMPWALPEAEALPFYERAIESGINFFDNADSYSTGLAEEIFGRAIAKIGVPRDRIVIGTKVFGAMGPDVNQRGLSRKHIRHAIDDSLRRLGVDYVDLYQIHRLDPTTSPEEIMEALDDVVRAGKALHIGASSMYAWQFAKLQSIAERAGSARFVTMQNRYNLLYREEEREMVPLCIDQGVGIIPYSPLARGLLTGSRRRGTKRSEVVKDFTRPEDEAVVDRVLAVAERRGESPARIALAWLLSRPGVTAPIVGATKLSHLDDAIAALETKLSPEEIAELEEPYGCQPPQFDRATVPSHNHAAAAALAAARGEA
ncbi:aldo/keto reductase [Sphingomonas sp. AP4-R1]|uniref:aldo/keto reductase n=1 Tax=Sphingomonas sp. AP4-R1 TaxID=2735134 RepID=UPI0014937F1F|nr:aldo/keto reductase [Sphingomonas sp. AP4-R1]QJU57359.1 aldo/keto reductase [Sphingomonas sp. AP4-R1]